MARYEREQDEKTLQRAEELFLASNIRGAHRHASRAERLCPSLPGLANALAAYQVHAAAGAGGSCNWRAVLGMRPGDAATPDAIKKQYRRLSLLVHPDKARCCAAAEGAFKLLRRACEDALNAGCSRDATTSRPYVPRAAAPPPPPMHVPLEAILIYCPSCKNEFARKIGRVEQHAGMKCAWCPVWLNPPWQKKPPVKKEPPTRPGRQVFQCPAKCPECRAQYTSMVLVGRWCLRCKACSNAAMVNVQGPDQATTAIKSRT